MHSPLVLAEKTLGAPNFASCGHQTGALPPISALPIYPHTATAGDAQMRLPGPLTSPEPRRPGTARREPAGKELAEPSPASLPAHDRSKGRSPARRLPPLSQPLPALLHEPRAQFRLPPLPPVGRPSRAGGKRRAEPSTTSRRAHGRSKGRGPARRLPPLSQPLPALLHEPRAQFRLPPPRSCRWAAPRWREEARRAIGDVPASSWAPKRSHRPVAPPSAPPRAATVRPPGLAYTG